MNKKKLIALLVGFLLCISGWQLVKASQQNLESDYYKLGYTSISNAVQETESYYKTKLDLPSKIAPLDFTHSFGRFNKENDNLELEYLNNKEHTNYIINVFPSKIKINKFINTNDTQISLKDGTQAYYSYSTGEAEVKVITLKFEKNKWIYLLSIQENLLTNPLSELQEIANSF